MAVTSDTSGGPGDIPKIRQAIRTPKSAAVAGIVFSLCFGVVIWLIRSVAPPDQAVPGELVTSAAERNKVLLAMYLLPIAGIAFLWFIGVIRDRIGHREDRFFATVFLGSGLLFVAMIFVAGAGLTSLLTAAADHPLSPELWRFGRAFSFTLMSIYALRMAAVFTICTTTLAGRLGLLPRWMVIVGYLSGALLLLTVNVIPRMELVFPAWVLLLSVHVLVVGPNPTAVEAPS
jgi:hypothetical protein